MTDSISDIRFFLIVGDQRDDLRLRENRAHTGDLDLLRRRQRDGSQLVQADFQRAGDHLQKASRPGSAFIIHDEVLHFPVLVQMDRFAVLSSDIQDSTDLRIEIMGSFPVTADLRHILVRKLNADPAIPGGHDPGYILPRQPCPLQHFIQRLLRADSGFCPGAHYRKCFNLSVPVHDHRVGGCGTAVYSQHIHGVLSLRLSLNSLYLRL